MRQRLSETSCTPTTFQSSLREITELVREQRDLTQLSEPLANSVLGYTLNGLSPDTNAESALSQDLERTIDADQTSGTLQDNSLSMQPQSSREATMFNRQAFVNQAWTYSEPRPEEGHVTNQPLYGPIPTVHDSSVPGIDWFQWNVNDFQESMPADFDILAFDASM